MGRIEKQKRKLIEEPKVTVYQKGDKFLVTRRGHEEYVIKTFDNVEDALRFASDMTNEEKFRTEPEHFTHEDLPYDDSDVHLFI